MVGIRLISVIASLLFSFNVYADPQIGFLNSVDAAWSVNLTKQIKGLILEKFDLAEIEYIKIKPIYTSSHQVNYYLVFLLAKKTFSIKTLKVGIKNNELFIINDNYHLTDFELNTLSSYNKLGNMDCEDKSIEFVAASPMYSNKDFPTIKRSIDKVSAAAVSRGLHVKQLLDTDASVDKYIGYLKCPHLKGFYSIGHGDPDLIFLYDSVLDAYFISLFLTDKLHNKVIIEFNSCEVFNKPMKPAVIKDAGAQKYIGGISMLKIGPSEAASTCFWEHTFDGYNMKDSIKNCNKHFDPKDIFGIGGKGSNYFK